MQISLKHFLYSFVAMFVAIDAIGILPVFLSITQKYDAKKKRDVVKQSLIVALTVALVFLVMGNTIFKLMGIALHDFKVGGGIVLLVMAILDLVKSKNSDDHTKSTGVVPIAVPLITGPALITTIMLQVGIYGYPIVFLSLLLNFVFIWFVLNKSVWITKMLGEEGTDIVSKIAALFMTAIAFSMIRSGVFESMVK